MKPTRKPPTDRQIRQRKLAWHKGQLLCMRNMVKRMNQNVSEMKLSPSMEIFPEQPLGWIERRLVDVDYALASMVRDSVNRKSAAALNKKLTKCLRLNLPISS